MMDKLLPCPFCGGEAEMFQGSRENEHTVRCVQCAIKMPIQLNRKGAINAWNCRAIDAAPVVHGRWHAEYTRRKDELGLCCLDEFYSCSLCDYASDERTNYCPNCGAKMDRTAPIPMMDIDGEDPRDVLDGLGIRGKHDRP